LTRPHGRAAEARAAGPGDLAREATLAALLSEDLGRARLARLSEHSTMGVGGPAVVLEVPDLARLKAFLALAAERGWSRLVVGQGSNILFPDQGLTAVAVRLVGELAAISAEGPAPVLSAGAGASAARLLYAAQGRGLAGLEFLAGVPGTVGGAVRGNAGAAGADMASALESATLLRPSGEPKAFGPEELGPGYRSMALPPGWEEAVVVEAAVRLAPSSPQAVRAAIDERLKARAKGQPKGRSLGCVFKNPPGDHAGRLIDQCGLKGRRKGGAVVSRDHANFIVNQGGATAADVIGLAAEIRARVAESLGTLLEPEIRLVDPSGAPIRLPGPAGPGARAEG
jgi:UDP-N-acetylmuramate dehydrogenase